MYFWIVSFAPGQSRDCLNANLLTRLTRLTVKVLGKTDQQQIVTKRNKTSTVFIIDMGFCIAKQIVI